MYEATATGYVTAGATANTPTRPIADSLAKAKVTSYVAIATSTKVANRVIKSLGLDDDAGALIGEISVDQPTDTVLLNVHARAGDAQDAQDLANAWVAALAAEIQDLDVRQLRHEYDVTVGR